jgi:hypothetical protein
MHVTRVVRQETVDGWTNYARIVEPLLVTIAVLLALCCWITAAADVWHYQPIVETMNRLGVSLRALPVLAVLKIAGGLGLIVGQWNEKLLTAASVSLAAYFAAATVVHLRVRDSFRSVAPAGALMLISVVVFADSFTK